MQSSSVVDGGRNLEASEGRRMVLCHCGVVAREAEAASSESRRAALLCGGCSGCSGGLELGRARVAVGAAALPVAPNPSPGRRPLGPCRVSRCALALATPRGGMVSRPAMSVC